MKFIEDEGGVHISNQSEESLSNPRLALVKAKEQIEENIWIRQQYRLPAQECFKSFTVTF